MWYAEEMESDEPTITVKWAGPGEPNQDIARWLRDCNAALVELERQSERARLAHLDVAYLVTIHGSAEIYLDDDGTLKARVPVWPSP